MAIKSDPVVPAVGAVLFAGLWGARANAYEDWTRTDKNGKEG